MERGKSRIGAGATLFTVLAVMTLVIMAHGEDSAPSSRYMGGPAELVRRFDLPHNEGYADACHLCYSTRKTLRSRYPNLLGPDQIYGIYAA